MHYSVLLVHTIGKLTLKHKQTEVQMLKNHMLSSKILSAELEYSRSNLQKALDILYEVNSELEGEHLIDEATEEGRTISIFIDSAIKTIRRDLGELTFLEAPIATPTLALTTASLLLKATFHGTFTCKRCKHTWIPRKPGKPLRCAACKSPYWERPIGL